MTGVQTCALPIYTLKDGGTRYDELGVFLPLEHFADRLERHVETATKIVYGE